MQKEHFFPNIYLLDIFFIFIFAPAIKNRRSFFTTNFTIKIVKNRHHKNSIFYDYYKMINIDGWL